MNDPHVVALHYQLVAEDGHRFDPPPQLAHNASAFALTIAGTTVVAKMHAHHPSAASARAEVEPFLRAWEMDFGLQAGENAFSFVFERPEIIDRQPSPSGNTMELKATVGSSATLDVMVVHHRFPSPPTGFVASPDVETMWHRYARYRKGHEPVSGMAYFCLTVLETSAGGRKQVTDQYQVSGKVLSTLGRLCGEVGDAITARKFLSPSQRAHTNTEIIWIEAAVRALIRRTAEYSSSAGQPSIITMEDLPPL